MFSWKPDAMVVQEREVCAKTSHTSEDRGASRKLTALFSPNRNEQRNQMWSSVFGNANPSNLSGTLLEGNKDHLMSQARSDLAKRELHVKSLNKVIYKNERRSKARYHRTHKTNLLNLVENKLDCKRNCYERKKLFEIHRYEESTKWEK